MPGKRTRQPTCLDYVKAARDLWRDGLDAAAPTVASLADANPDQPWRPDALDTYCHRCGRTTGPHEATDRGCSVCLKQRLPWERVTRLAEYTDPVPGWIKAMKYHGQWPIARWLGQELGTTLRTHRTSDGPGFDVVTHVPMHPVRRFYRGYDQAQVISKQVAQSLALPCDTLLRRTQWTKKQSVVDPARRIGNVKHAFAAARVDLSGCCVLLIDDVKTSGATLKACSRCLKRAGARRVEVGVIAVA